LALALSSKKTMGGLTIFHMLIVLAIPVGLFFVIRWLLGPSPGDVANTWKFKTVISLIFALFVPFWPVTAPVFLYLAYRSYSKGEKAPVPVVIVDSFSTNKAEEIAALHALLSNGALTQAEFDEQKQKNLNR
jgi:competence protein ComGC